jgi:hypothetical protein
MESLLEKMLDIKNFLLTFISRIKKAVHDRGIRVKNHENTEFWSQSEDFYFTV